MENTIFKRLTLCHLFIPFTKYFNLSINVNEYFRLWILMKKPPKSSRLCNVYCWTQFQKHLFKENELWNICEITTNKITLKKIVNYTLWNYMLGRVVKHYSLVLEPTKLISDGGIWAIILSHPNQSGPWTL